MKIFLSRKKIGTYLLGLSLLLVSEGLHARKLNMKFGFFDVSAKTSVKKGNLNAVGAYNVSLTQAIRDNLEASIGYTLMMSKTVGGDLGFGLDIGLNYYPFSRITPQKTELKSASIYIEELWRPYIGVGFTERRFQSVESNYAGFSVSFGTERQLEVEDYSLILELKYSSLGGTSSSTATELTVMSGLSIPFK